MHRLPVQKRVLRVWPGKSSAMDDCVEQPSQQTAAASEVKGSVSGCRLRDRPVKPLLPALHRPLVSVSRFLRAPFPFPFPFPFLFPCWRLQKGKKAKRQKGKKAIIHEMGFKLCYAGFETCFGWDPQHQSCQDLIKKSISNLDVALRNKGERKHVKGY